MRICYKLSVVAGAFFCLGILPAAFAQVSIAWNPADCCGTTLYGQETGPYNVTINGVAAQVLCDDLAAQFVPPKTWDAEVTTPGAGTKFGGNYVSTLLGTGVTTEQAYSAIAYLAEQLGAPGTDSGLLNFAIWDIFDYADVHGSDGSQLGATNLATVDSLARTALQNATPANLAGITIYTPVTGPDDGSDPNLLQDQELISLTPTPTPEASASTILAFDLLGVGATVLFFRRRKSRAA